jgi:hypothetical protein
MNFTDALKKIDKITSLKVEFKPRGPFPSKDLYDDKAFMAAIEAGMVETNSTHTTLSVEYDRATFQIDVWRRGDKYTYKYSPGIPIIWGLLNKRKLFAIKQIVRYIFTPALKQEMQEWIRFVIWEQSYNDKYWYQHTAK